MTTTIECPAFKPTLRIGDRGQDVKEMQKRLNLRLTSIYTYSQSVEVDGIFGQKTEVAVKYLQCLGFLKVTGITDGATWNFICDGAKSLPVLAFPGLPASGDAIAQVKLVQKVLYDCGFYQGVINQIDGKEMAKAVIAFQKHHRLTADGVIGVNTWNTLIKLDSHVDGCYCNYYGCGC